MFPQLLQLADPKRRPERWKGELSVLVPAYSTGTPATQHNVEDWDLVFEQGFECFHDDEVEMLPP